MNAAKQIQQTGSESSNAIDKEQRKKELMQIRQSVAGQRAELIFTDEDTNAAYFFGSIEGSTACIGLGFSGNRTKPDFYYRFSSAERAEAYRAEWFDRLQATKKAKLQRKAERAAKVKEGHKLNVGDILCASWGYDQTNYDYYQVTRLVGAQSVEIRELQQSRNYTGDMEGDCIPMKDRFSSAPEIKRVTGKGDSVKVRSWGVYAHKVEPKLIGGIPIFPTNHFTAYH